MWESRVLRRAFERLELHEGKLSRAVLRGGGGGDVTSLPDTWVGNHPGLPGPKSRTPKSRKEVGFGEKCQDCSVDSTARCGGSGLRAAACHCCLCHSTNLS